MTPAERYAARIEKTRPELAEGWRSLCRSCMYRHCEACDPQDAASMCPYSDSDALDEVEA